jgi:methyl-accepting chemotaxis protein
MERSCTAILASLTHLDSAEADTQAIGGFLTETIGRMQESMRGIQTIEIQMHLVALNAGICAAHIGSAGDALGVIAQSMHLRAEESRECCGLLVETLDSICEGVNRIVGNRGSVSGVEPGRENNVMEQMRLAIAELHSSTERSFSQIRQIVERGARLGEELCATRTSFTVGSLFAGAISTAQQRLKQIAETIPSSLVPEGRSASESGLAEFARYYTMQAERDVHDSLSLASVAAEPLGGFAEAPGFASVPAEELGENVEFF